MFGSNWREVELALYADSVLAWLGEGGEMLGGAKLVSSPDLIAAGQYTSNIPNRPDLPSGYTTGRVVEPGCPLLIMLTAGQVMAVGTRPSNKVHWLLVDSEQEVGVIICHH